MTRASSARLGVSRLVEIVDGHVQVACRQVEHAARTVARRALVAHSQGLDQFPVDVKGLVTLFDGTVGNMQGIFQGGVDNARQLAEHLIVAGSEQYRVKCHIRLGEAFDIAFYVLHLLPGLFQVGDILRRGAFRRKFRRHRLDGPTGLENAADEIEVEYSWAYPFQHLLVQNVPVVLVADDRADARTSAHHPFGFEDFQRFTNDGATDTVEFTEIVFARQERACGEFLVTDVESKGRRDALLNAGTPCGADVRIGGQFFHIRLHGLHSFSAATHLGSDITYGMTTPIIILRQLTGMMIHPRPRGLRGSSGKGRETMQFFKAILLAGTVAIMGMTSAAAADIKIGFVVKQPEEPWFQDEWKFAEVAAKEKGFTLVKIGADDGEKVQSAIDNLGAQGAQGFIICTPDVKLGPGIVAKATGNDLKVMTVDDRLVGADGKPLEDVPHMGISATKIGEAVGQALSDEIKKRGWDPKTVGAIRVSYDQLPTAVDRVGGAVAVLKANGFPAENIFDAPQAKTDTEAALNASTTVLNKHSDIKNWIAFGLNDEAALGAVRATESVGIPAGNVISIGIGGAESAINEFKKPSATGFIGTVIISPKRHGYETALNMYEWIANDKQPEKVILTAGQLALRDNYKTVRKDLGIE